MRRFRIVVFLAAALALAPAAAAPGSPGPEAADPVAQLEGAGLWACFACLAGATAQTASSPYLSGSYYGSCAAACPMTL